MRRAHVLPCHAERVDFLPAGFPPPDPLVTPRFRLALLGPKHAASDYAAWTSSIDFIRRLPGWATSTWPLPISPEANFRDCEEHLRRSRAGLDFAYTVLLPDRDEVVGCVYFRPPTPPRAGAVEVRSWVTEAQARRDRPLQDALERWLDEPWPWTDVNSAPRRRQRREPIALPMWNGDWGRPGKSTRRSSRRQQVGLRGACVVRRDALSPVAPRNRRSNPELY